jgi:excisionase family DNA binding protein
MSDDAVHSSSAAPLGEPLLDAAAVAAFLGVDRSTVYRLAGAVHGLPVVAIGRTKRFRPADVRAFVERSARGGQVRSGRGERLLAAVRSPRPNELASPGKQSVHRRRES